jgi:hypothetical protein
MSTAIDNPAVGVLPSCAGAAVIGGDAGVDADSYHADIMGVSKNPLKAEVKTSMIAGRFGG